MAEKPEESNFLKTVSLQKRNPCTIEMKKNSNIHCRVFFGGGDFRESLICSIFEQQTSMSLEIAQPVLFKLPASHYQTNQISGYVMRKNLKHFSFNVFEMHGKYQFTKIQIHSTQGISSSIYKQLLL